MVLVLVMTISTAKSCRPSAKLPEATRLGILSIRSTLLKLVHILIIIVLICVSAFFSGANLGLMTLDPYDLARKVKLDDPQAIKVYPVRRHGNRLLVTLLIGNVAINAILAVYLGSLTTGILAVLLSTVLITTFGEILPQAFFAKYSLPIGARVAGLVQVLMWLLYPICGPVAWLLDHFLGEELPTIYSKEELIKILEEHRLHDSSDIEADEERIARGALTFGERTVGEIMTPWSVVRTVSIDQVLDQKLINELITSGLSRFPVIETLDDQPRAVAILYLRDLVKSTALGKRVSAVDRQPARFVQDSIPADDALRAFIKYKTHLFVVTNEFSQLVGVVTIEDVLEEVIGQEIIGEFDVHPDMRLVAARKQKLGTYRRRKSK